MVIIRLGDICQKYIRGVWGDDIHSLIVVTEVFSGDLVRGYEVDSNGRHFNRVTEGCYFTGDLEAIDNIGGW